MLPTPSGSSAEEDARERAVHLAEHAQVEPAVLGPPRVADLHDAPTVAGGLDASGDRRANRIDDEIDAAPATQPPRLRDPIVVAVVYPVVQPELLQPLQLLVARGRR